MKSAAARNIDPLTLREAMGRFATGVTVVSTFDGEKREGLTINSFASLSLDPPMVLWSIRKNSPSLETFLRAPYFVVNVLSASRQHLSQHFATPLIDKFSGVDFHEGLGGCPVLKGNLASFECIRTQAIEGGDHLIILGEVADLCYSDDVPLIFSNGRYCTPAT